MRLSLRYERGPTLFRSLVSALSVAFVFARVFAFVFASVNVSRQSRPAKLNLPGASRRANGRLAA
jgi:hypothetical protein